MPYQQTLANGTVLIDEFRIMGHLGSGGFANTYLAMDLTLGREVAIKEYFPSELAIRASSERVEVKSSSHGAQFEWALGRFVREAKTLAKFRHPSVVRVFRVFNANDTAYIVLEFVRGSNMESWIKSLGRPPTQAEFDELLPPMLDALEVVHGAGILHRDIKPANIYIRGADHTPVLLDFGAARYAAGDYAGTTAAIVSKGYSPHEAYATDSRLQGPWTDIYGLAATIYRSLSGTAPPESTMRVLEDHCIPAVSLELPEDGGYREEFLSAIDWALAVMPRDRPQSIAEWRYNLLPATAGQPRLRDANGDPTTVQEWNPISDAGQATTFDPPGASGSRPQTGGSQPRRQWPTAPGPQSGTSPRPSAASAGRSAIVGGVQQAPRQAPSRPGPNKSAPPSAAPVSSPASSASVGRQPVPPPGVVDRHSAPVGNRTFIIGLALFAAGGLALAGQWFVSRDTADPVTATSPVRIEREVAGIDAERRNRERANEQAGRDAEIERRRAAEEAEGKKAADAEAERRRAADEAERTRRAEAEIERRRQADEAEAKRRAEIEAERKRVAAEQAERRRIAEEAERKRLADAAEAKRVAEAAAERKRLADEAEAKRVAEAAAERKRLADEAEAKRVAEAAAERKRLADEAEAKRRADAERKRIAEEEADRKRRLEIQLAARQTEAQGGGTELAAASTTGDTSDARHSPLAGVYGTDESSRRIGYLKNMQAALQSSKCYQGALDGEVNSTRDALSAFEERYQGDVMKIDVASASSSDFERWLGWFWRQESFYCYEKPSKQPDASTTRRRSRDADEAKERRQREREADEARAAREAREARERRQQERLERKSRAEKVTAPVQRRPKAAAPAYKPPKAPAYRPPSGGGGGGGGGGSDLLRGGR